MCYDGLSTSQHNDKQTIKTCYLLRRHKEKYLARKYAIFGERGRFPQCCTGTWQSPLLCLWQKRSLTRSTGRREKAPFFLLSLERRRPPCSSGECNATPCLENPSTWFFTSRAWMKRLKSWCPCIWKGRRLPLRTLKAPLFKTCTRLRFRPCPKTFQARLELMFWASRLWKPASWLKTSRLLP